MLLVYFITSLPRLELGAEPPLSRLEFIARAREALSGDERTELDRLLLLEEVDETVRLMGALKAERGDITSSELTVHLRTERRRTPEGPGPDELPDWVMMPLPQDVLYGRFFHMLRHKARSPLLRHYATFTLELEQALSSLVSSGDTPPLKEQLREPEVLAGAPPLEDGVALEPPWLSQVKAALKDEDLMEMERALDRMRWEKLDELRGTDPLSVEVVLAFYLQLRLLEREATWDKAKGRIRLEELLRLPATSGLGDGNGVSA